MIVYDLECLKGLFTATFSDLQGNVRYFIIHSSRNDLQDLKDYLSTVDTLIGFNNVGYDWPLLNWIVQRDKVTPAQIYKKSQHILDSERPQIFQPTIKQIDLYLLNHYDNSAKSASLKWLQIGMGFENVMDMPIHHSEAPTTAQIADVLKYNLNDVMATLELYNRSKQLLEIRKAQGDRYGIDMTNFSNSKMGETILLKRLADKMEMSFESVKKLGGPLTPIALRDVILPSISFKSKEFKSVYDRFMQATVYPDKKLENIAVNFNGIDYYFGEGGLHAAAEAGIYHNLHSSDVVSYYPSSAVSQRYKITQFGDHFTNEYAAIIEERKSFPKGTPDNAALKEALNSAFGKSKSEFSPLRSMSFFYSIVINGQLMLAMLCERIEMMGIGRIIIANTDGIEVDVKDVGRYMWLCGEWEKKFGLTLEHGIYKKLALNSVNNYIAIGNKVKEKGFYVTDPDLHKNRSSLVIQKAVKEFIVNNIPIEKTIKEEQDIKLFLIGARAKTGKFIAKSITGEETLQKNIRYYISNRGVKLYKRLKDGDVEEHRGYFITMANQLPTELVDVDYSYYIKEANKLISPFYEKQYSVF